MHGNESLNYDAEYEIKDKKRNKFMILV